MEFRRVAELCERLERTRGRKEKVEMVSSFLSSLSKEEMEPFCHLLLGRPLPPSSPLTLGVDWTTVRRALLGVTGLTPSDLFRAFHSTGDLGETARLLFQRRRYFSPTLDSRPLELLEVWGTLGRMASEGEREKKERLLEGLLNRSSPEEAKLVVKVVIGEMRTGFKEGMLLSSLALSFGMSEEEIRRSFALLADAGRLAGLLAEKGAPPLVVPFQPLQPMLAQPAGGVEEILREHGTTSMEVKLDGARIQVHKRGREVRIFSRGSKEVTGSLPEVAEEVRGLEVREAILDGEVVAVDEGGRPMPFQNLLRRFRRKRGVEETQRKVPLRAWFFDLLYLDGTPMLDLPYSRRREKLEEVCGERVTERIVTSSVEEAKRFLEKARGEGHEGIVAKLPEGPYLPGARGKLWLKFKPVPETLDLVIVGAEWGYGRRARYLSDYYLAAWDQEKGKFEVVGKTFKGLTDEELAEMTERLKALEVSREGRRIWVRPEVVVEVAYNEIQRSPRYPCGMALRLARIVRVREDKKAQEADTLGRMRELFEKQERK